MTSRKLTIALIGLSAIFGGLTTASAQTAPTTAPTAAAPATPAAKTTVVKTATPKATRVARAAHRRMTARAVARRQMIRHERRLALRRAAHARHLAQSKTAPMTVKATARAG